MGGLFEILVLVPQLPRGSDLAALRATGVSKLGNMGLARPGRSSAACFGVANRASAPLDRLCL